MALLVSYSIIHLLCDMKLSAAQRSQKPKCFGFVLGQVVELLGDHVTSNNLYHYNFIRQRKKNVQLLTTNSNHNLNPDTSFLNQERAEIIVDF